MDPREALDRFAERLEETRSTLQSRIEDLAAEENPFAAISEQLTRLYAQKDATVETVFARLAPLEARLAELEGSLGRMDPREALDRFAERLEETRSTLQSRIEDSASEENPFAAISEQLTRLYAQKDATVETVFARLAPLEARLAELEGSLGRMDPREALDRFAERLEETRSHAAVADRGSGVRGEPVRGDLGAADAALRAEGCDGGDGVRAAGALGGAACGAGRLAGADGPARGLGPLRGAAGGDSNRAAGADRGGAGENPFAANSEH